MRMKTAVAGTTPRFAPFAAAAVLALSGCAAATGSSTPAPSAAPPPGSPGSTAADNRGSADGPGGTPGASEPAGPLEGATVVVDPGHNGGNADAPDRISESVDAGHGRKACDTVGAETDTGYTEHAFNWDVAKRLRSHLEERGAEVVLTREDDESVGPCITERAEIGNEARADAAISIHADGGPPSGRGFHVIAPGELDGYTDDIAEPSHRLAVDLRAEFEEGTGRPRADYIAEDGLDLRTDLGGLNLSDVPKVFLEAGNMRNSADAAKLTDPEWRESAAESIAAGISRFLRDEQGGHDG
ncbi:N-acetylmuramoyl-L-alanine amidase [Streptomonospora litoralis]|uniref:N-acetylmuramoyl-L-alanine amidase LytC n=1 Tax=Streptomonospora litoralis TaxID=2498135 RepID=A0A4P6Q0C4_9ACTN|nr:N-acetylmuramoyl-L-alanine amidase [Streptomonospora litoralis]QBI52124.1 N-acetylmuramoyl-L-alanine amidase LytC precursor [Streptomonospora litoralis]